MKNWTFSLSLAVFYLAVFNLWRFADRDLTIVSALGASAVLVAGFLRAANRHYFRNRIDALLHTVVILDVLLEGLFVTTHGSSGFYFCALEFATVVGGYRYWCLRRSLATGH